jgi:DNA damage-inducible protein 1
MTVSTLRDSISRETQIPLGDQHMYHNGHLITDDSNTMEQLAIHDGELLALHVRDMRGSTGVPETRRATQQRGLRADPEMLRLQLLGSPATRAELQRTNPELAVALDDPERFAQLIRGNDERERRARLERQQQIQRLNDDPFDQEKQKMIEEMIRQERVMENLQSAMEHNPEG